MCKFIYVFTYAQRILNDKTGRRNLPAIHVLFAVAGSHLL